MTTYVSDALAPNLLTGTTLNSAASSNGTIYEVDWPGFVKFVLVTSTVTGTTPTLDLTIQGSDSPTFAASSIVTIGKFKQVGAESAATHEMTAEVRTKYVRAAIVVGGTSPVYTASTLYPCQAHYQWTRLDSAGVVA